MDQYSSNRFAKAPAPPIFLAICSFVPVPGCGVKMANISRNMVQMNFSTNLILTWMVTLPFGGGGGCGRSPTLMPLSPPYEARTTALIAFFNSGSGAGGVTGTTAGWVTPSSLDGSFSASLSPLVSFTSFALSLGATSVGLGSSLGFEAASPPSFASGAGVSANSIFY